MKFSSTSLLLLLSSSLTAVKAGSEWARLGQPLCKSGEGFGTSMALSDMPGKDKVGDENFVMAVGSPWYTDDHYRQGRVQFYQFSPGKCLWESTFADPLVGERTEDRLGYQVALSCNAERVAVSGDLEDFEQRQGFVQVYTRSGGGWRQLGQTLIDAQSFNYPYTKTNFGGYGLDLNCAGDLLKVESDEGIHLYTYSESTQEWIVSKFIERGSEVNDLARDGNMLAIQEGPYEVRTGDSSSPTFTRIPSHIAVYQLRGSAWVLRGMNNITLPDEATPRSVSISNNGNTVAVRGSGEEFVYQFLPGADTWNRTGVNSNLAGGSSGVGLSGDGDTVFGVESSQLYAYREFTVKIDPDQVEEGQPNTEKQWLRVGGSIGLSTGDSFNDASVSQSGSVVALAGSSILEAYFFPDDESIVQRSGFDCYPDYSLPEARECNPIVESEPEVTRIEGNIDLDDIGAGAAVGIVFGVLACCVGTVAIGLFVWLKNAGKKDTGARAARPPTMKQLDSEMAPLAYESPPPHQDETHIAGSDEEHAVRRAYRPDEGDDKPSDTSF